MLGSSGHIRVGGKTSGASSRAARLDSGGHDDSDIKWVGEEFQSGWGSGKQRDRDGKGWGKCKKQKVEYWGKRQQS